MNYIHLNFKHYSDFIESNKSDRLCKNLKLFTKSKRLLEVFDGDIETEYEIITNNKRESLITFKSISGEKYRIDIYKVFENIGTVNHISFSTFDKDLDDSDYEEPTNKNEVYDVLNRIKFILNDMIKCVELESRKFCIGGTKFTSKNLIYKYILTKIVGESGVMKRETPLYETGWGLYFMI